MDTTLAKSNGLPKQLAGRLSFRLSASFAVAAVMWPVLRHLYRDYNRFVALGPGGTPPTFSGYLKVKALSFFALKNPCAPAPIPKRFRNCPGFLAEVPVRVQPRPRTEGIAPHRQTTQRASQAIYEKLAAAIHQIGLNDEHLVLGTSCFEKHGTGLFSISPDRQTCKGEICHVHPSDGSLHMTLQPADANTVLEAGWGERHPLARGGWFERFVPGSFVMVYAPTTEEEIETVLTIVRAAVWYVGAGDGVRDCATARKDSGYVSAEDDMK